MKFAVLILYIALVLIYVEAVLMTIPFLPSDNRLEKVVAIVVMALLGMVLLISGFGLFQGVFLGG